jgi:prepilin-type N-terminal cleavage/methylation domain-containing protein
VAIGLHRGAAVRGMTLIELMIVVAIIGVMSFAAILAMGPSNNAKSSAALARSLQFTLQRARTDAVNDNRQRQILCDATLKKCTYLIANAQGMGVVTFNDKLDDIQWGRHALVWNINNATDWDTNNSGAQMSGQKSVTFYPNGTATAATVYVADSASVKHYFYKVYVYGGTGLARLVDTW